MKTFAPEKTKDTRVREGSTNSRISELTWPVLDLSGYSAAPIFRKTSCPCGGGCPACQAKSSDLKVSQPNDPAEIEADQIADRVMRMPVGERKPRSATGAPTPIGGSPSTVHRKCDTCEDEEETIQRKALPSGGGIPSQSLAHVQSAIGSGGRPLDRETRSFFEPRLGYDLSSVRIHTGGTADESAREIDARAYTLGSNIVFSSGEYDPGNAGGKRLLAHELAHVVQQPFHEPQLLRQPTERICVPGSPADAPECVESRKREQEAAEEKKKPGTTIAVTDVSMSFPSGVGLRVHAHQDAVKGINDWSSVYGTANSANNHNKFNVGTFRLQQICQPDTSSSWAVYLYFVTDSDGDHYAVGPDSLSQFVLRHGGIITADGGNTDQLGGGKAMLDARQLPAAADAFTEEPTIYYAAPRLPAYDEVSDAFHIGYYRMKGYLRRQNDGSLAVLYYVAENMVSLFRPEYVVGPKWINIFSERQGGYGLVAEFSYPMEPGAMPSAYEIHSARFVMGVMKGDVERAESGVEAWKSAAKDPGWWFRVVTAYASAAQPRTPAPKTSGPPNLRIIQGGKGSAPVVNEPMVNTGGASRSSAYVGRDSTARALAVDPAPVSTPITAPRHLQSVPAPAWNPAPLPQPISPLASMAGQGAVSSLGTGLALGPDVDIDLDRRTRRGSCNYESIGQQFGRYPCHAAYATRLSGVNREVRVRTPEKLSADFDAFDHGNTLYEVKTGYRWMVFMGSNEARAEIIQRFWTQATEQLIIADRCGHELRWYFNDPYVASFFGAENSPYPDYFEAALPVSVWYVPFNCDQDSG